MNGIREERLRYETVDGLHLVGVVVRPEHPNAFVLMMHGIGADKNEYQNFHRGMADDFAIGGIASLRFDFRGHGESDGSSADISISGEMLDIKASVIQLRRYWRKSFSMIARSFAAGPAISSCVELRDVDKLVLMAPVLDYEATFLGSGASSERPLFSQKSVESSEELGYIELDGLRLSPKLVEEFRIVKPYLLLRSLSIPVLLIHGSMDPSVPYEISAESAAANKNIHFLTIENAGHGYANYDDPSGEDHESQSNKKKIIRSIERFLLR